MQMTWFDMGWPFVGLGGAIVMLAIMLMTNTFRGNATVSRWCDPVWLGWLAAPVYWIHQFEEYSLTVLGFGHYAIQGAVCKNMGYPAYPDCPIPLAFYPLVNITLMWVGAPLAAYLGRRNLIIGLSFWGMILLNGVAHVAATAALRGYNAGLFSGLFFIPLSVWVFYACAIRGPYSGKVVGLAFGAGILAHIFLGVDYGLQKIGAINGTGVLAVAVVVGFSPILFAALGSRFVQPESLRPNAAQ